MFFPSDILTHTKIKIKKNTKNTDCIFKQKLSEMGPQFECLAELVTKWDTAVDNKNNKHKKQAHILLFCIC